MGASCCNTDVTTADGDFTQLQRTIAPRRQGKYLKSEDLPPGFYFAVRNAVIEAEGRMGGPVHHVDIYRALIELG